MPPIVIYYHQLVERRTPGHQFLQQATTFAEFLAAMEFLAAEMHPLSLDEFLFYLRGNKRWPDRSVLVTFDDGYQTNLAAAEVLANLGMQGLFFIISGAIDTPFVPWYLRFAHLVSTNAIESCPSPIGEFRLSPRPARRKSLARMKEHLLSISAQERDDCLEELAERLHSRPFPTGDESFRFLNSGEVRRLAALGMAVGNHSATHTNLRLCNDRELQAEIVESNERLAAASGIPVTTISYPDGRHDRRVVECAKQCHAAGFAASPTTSWSDGYRIPRRAADGVVDLRDLFGRWYLWRHRTRNLAKRLLGIPTG